MAKYGYTCKCSWTLRRGRLTRREYARAKELHSDNCEALRKELEQSKGVKKAA